MMKRTVKTRHAMDAPIDRIAPLRLLLDILVFLLGLTTQFTVRIVGDLPVAELIVLILILPMLVIFRSKAFRRDLLWMYALMGLWLMNQVLTDIYRQTERVDWMRGNAAIVFLLADLAFVAMVIGDSPRRKLVMIAGVVIGSLLATRYAPSEFAMQYPWKFGYSMGANISVAALSCFFYNRRRYNVVLLLLLGISALNLYFNFRSPVLMFLLTIVLAVPVIPERIGLWQVLPPQGTRMRLVVLAGIAILASAAAGGIVKLAASSGLLGEDAQLKNERQARVKGGLLLGGRPEIMVSTVAVMHSPILGYGSWARDFKYIELLLDTMQERGAQVEDVDALEGAGDGLIPTHSHVMSAWVWAGIMGAVFWIYAFWILLKAVVQVAAYHPPYAPLAAFLMLGMIWDIWFSPFGSSRRVVESIIIVIAMDLLKEAKPAFAQAATHVSRLRRWRRGAL